MKNKKLIIIVAVILLAYILVMLIFFNKKNDKVSGKYLIFDDINIKIDNGTWKKIDGNDLQKLNIKFNTFVDNEFYGNYYLKYGSTWNLFNDKNEFVSYDGKLFAYTNGINIKLKNLNNTKLSDSDKTYLTNKYNIKNFDDLTTEEVYNLDIDDNGVIDKIICLSRIDSLTSSLDENYNLVLVIFNNKVLELVKEKGNKVYKIYNIDFAFNMNSSYVIVKDVEGFYTDQAVTTKTIYMLKNNKYKKVISN